MQWRVVPVTFFPSLIPLLSTDGIVSSTQQVSVPSHLMVTPGSEHECGGHLSEQGKNLSGATPEGNGTPPPPKINSQYTLREGWGGLVGPSPFVANC